MLGSARGQALIESLVTASFVLASLQALFFAFYWALMFFIADRELYHALLCIAGRDPKYICTQRSLSKIQMADLLHRHIQLELTKTRSKLNGHVNIAMPLNTNLRIEKSISLPIERNTHGSL